MILTKTLILIFLQKCTIVFLGYDETSKKKKSVEVEHFHLFQKKGIKKLKRLQKKWCRENQHKNYNNKDYEK